LIGKRKVCFFEKKQQRTFAYEVRQQQIKVFWFFFSKKNQLLSIQPNARRQHP